MRKRDRLLPKKFRPKPVISNVTQPSSCAVQPAHASSTQGTSTTTTASGSRALELAIKRHLCKLTDAEKEAFREASRSIDENNLLSRVRACNDAHKQSSTFRTQATRLEKLLNLLNRFMGGIAIGIQAYQEISSLVVGAVRIVIDLAIDFTTFFNKLTDMLCQFEDYLGPLTEYAKGSQDSVHVQETLAKVYGDLLDFCQKARSVFVDTSGNPRKWTSWRLFLRQQWEPFETEFGSIRTDMQRHPDVLLHSVQALQLSENREAKLQENKKERESFLDWISTFDFEKVHDSIYAKKHEGTGDWLIQTEEFRTWFSSSKSSLLWCYGMPGAGKSVLASNVLEHITAKCALDENIAICFAYYNYRTPELQDPSQIVAALIKQLCRKRDTIPPWLLKFKYDSLSTSTASKQESFIKLAEDLEFKEVFVVIDALDECPLHERHHIIRFITGVMKALRCAKIFVTSRRVSDIVRAFKESSTPTIQIKAENVAADIESFVHNEVEKLRKGYYGKKLQLTSDVLEARIVQTLTEKAEGMFLWVNLQLESLCQISEAGKDSQVEAALDTLPQGLDETYTRIVERIDDQPEYMKYMKELAFNCLTWVLYAKRPLKTQELQHALAIGRTRQNQTDMDVDKVEVILEACGNLLIEENNAIRPVHYSVQEFFTRPPSKIPRRHIQESLADPEFVHTTLASICLRYIQLGTLSQPCRSSYDLDQRIYNAKFARYAAQHFDYHVWQCKSLPRDILELVEGLLDEGGTRFAAILQIRYLQDEIWDDHISMDFDPVSFVVSASTIVYGTYLFEIDHFRSRWVSLTPPEYALHQASSTGLVNAVKRLIEQGCSVNARDGKGTSPIYYASARGHLATTELLLSNGADVNAQGGYYGNALQAASLGGHDKIVELLLSSGADVNAQDGFYGNALQAASQGGHDKVVELLLSKGADVNAQCSYSIALQEASLHGHDKIVELLLRNGADVNAQGGRYGNALQAASQGGHDKTVELLLRNGANVNAQGGYSIALQAASLHGHDKIVKLLLSNGADVNARGRTYGNVLQAASQGGHDKVVELLLRNGADVNAQSGYYGNALQAASVRGHDKIVELLLRNGADVNAQGGHYGNALQAASLRGHDKIFELLLSNGANVNTQGGFYGNALQAASQGGHDRIFELLLSNGADVNAQGGEYGNALQAASQEGYDKIVELLLSNSANVNAQGGKYGNALQAASQGGHDKTFELLLGSGANVNAQGGEYGNALQAASLRGHDKTVELLLSNGANVNAQGGKYGNALQAASQGGRDKIVELLLSNGADVNAQGGKYGNALQAASQGHDKIVELLLRNGADVNAQGGYYGNALQAASQGGHDKIVKLLLSKSANVNAQGGKYGNALQAASQGGHGKIFELLLSNSADVNAQGGEYGNALQAASRGGHDKIVKLLLSKSADVDAQGGFYGNALQAALQGGHDKIFELLLSNSADVNAQGGFYGNALQAASRGGHYKIVELLLSKGVDVNAQGGFYGNALQAASQGYDKIVELLLRNGADVNAQGGYYGNALQAASQEGYNKISKLLLSNGANINAL